MFPQFSPTTFNRERNTLFRSLAHGALRMGRDTANHVISRLEGVRPFAVAACRGIPT
jgi:hypothetical protein